MPCMRFTQSAPLGPGGAYNPGVERKIFWLIFIGLGLLADMLLPLMWGVLATLPIAMLSWWIAYRSDWFT
jgi:hypothetical protein